MQYCKCLWETPSELNSSWFGQEAFAAAANLPCLYKAEEVAAVKQKVPRRRRTNMASIYGDIMKVDTTGASKKTADQDKLSTTGVEASHQLAKTDLARMNQYKGIITKVGNNAQIDPAVISGIISRESRAGAALINGWGDHGNGFGLMQVDKRHHRIVGEWNSEEHLIQGTKILTDFISGVKAKFPNWSKEKVLKGGIAAYNFGLKNVQTYERLDMGTTNNDYSNDVVARAQWYKQNGY
ncbi:lysozyme g-like [Arapaima gigas]